MTRLTRKIICTSKDVSRRGVILGTVSALLCLSFMLACLHAATPLRGNQQPMTTATDPCYHLINKENLADALQRNAADPIRMYQIVRSADFSGMKVDLARNLIKLHTEQPANPVIIDCLVILFDFPSPEKNRTDQDKADLLTARQLGDLDEALKLDKHLWLTYSWIGSSHFFQGERAQGLAECQQAIKLAPNVSYTHYYLGTLYQEYMIPSQNQQGGVSAVSAIDLSHYSALAASEFNKAIHLQPVSADAVSALWWVYMQTGKTMKARQTLAQYAPRIPKESENNLDNIQQSMIHWYDTR